MDSKASALSIQTFLKTANRLLRKKIKTIGNMKQFYVGINSLAYQIISNPAFEFGIGSSRYDDNPKLLKAVASILAYGEIAGKTELISSKPIQTLELDPFLLRNPKIEILIPKATEKAVVYFNLYKQYIESTEEDRKKFFNELTKNEDFKEAVATVLKASSGDTKLVVGALEYRDSDIYFKGSRVKLTPRQIIICRLLMGTPDKHVSDERLLDELGVDSLECLNMQKLVSKIRPSLVEAGCRMTIKRSLRSGYKLVSEQYSPNIRSKANK